MKKHLLTMILILATLVAVGFLPGPGETVQAINTDEPAQLEPITSVSADSADFSASPVIQIVVGLTSALFGILTFLPLLSNEDRRPEAIQQGGSDE
jgi:hypothetical protein